MRLNIFSIAVLFYLSIEAALAQKSADQNFYLKLAEFHSPIAIHEVGKAPKADVPTLFDYDGDAYADNNWDNLDLYPVPPAVYYEVIESESHYFITYAFFHPRDYSYVCMPMVCHENDLEGTILTIKKDITRYGRVVLAEALAHIGISGTEKPMMYYTYSQGSGGFIERVIVRIQDMGHGIYFWQGEWPKNYEIYVLNDDSNVSRLPKTPKRYSLHPLSYFWNLQRRQDADRIIDSYYDFKGSRFSLKNISSKFRSKKFGSGKVSFPWAWGKMGRDRGEWFLDPAFWVYKKLGQPEGFSLEYLYHPYLENRSSE